MPNTIQSPSGQAILSRLISAMRTHDNEMSFDQISDFFASEYGRSLDDQDLSMIHAVLDAYASETLACDTGNQILCIFQEIGDNQYELIADEETADALQNKADAFVSEAAIPADSFVPEARVENAVLEGSNEEEFAAANGLEEPSVYGDDVYDEMDRIVAQQQAESAALSERVNADASAMNTANDFANADTEISIDEISVRPEVMEHGSILTDRRQMDALDRDVSADAANSGSADDSARPDAGISTEELSFASENFAEDDSAADYDGSSFEAAQKNAAGTYAEASTDSSVKLNAEDSGTENTARLQRDDHAIMADYNAAQRAQAQAEARADRAEDDARNAYDHLGRMQGRLDEVMAENADLTERNDAYAQAQRDLDDQFEDEALRTDRKIRKAEDQITQQQRKIADHEEQIAANSTGFMKSLHKSQIRHDKKVIDRKVRKIDNLESERRM